MSDLAMQLSGGLLIAIVCGVIVFCLFVYQSTRIEDLIDRLRALEKHLGIEYVTRSEQCYTKAKGETE